MYMINNVKFIGSTPNRNVLLNRNAVKTMRMIMI